MSLSKSQRLSRKRKNVTGILEEIPECLDITDEFQEEMKNFSFHKNKRQKQNPSQLKITDWNYATSLKTFADGNINDSVVLQQKFGELTGDVLLDEKSRQLSSESSNKVGNKRVKKVKGLTGQCIYGKSTPFSSCMLPDEILPRVHTGLSDAIDVKETKSEDSGSSSCMNQDDINNFNPDFLTELERSACSVSEKLCPSCKHIVQVTSLPSHLTECLQQFRVTRSLAKGFGQHSSAESSHQNVNESVLVQQNTDFHEVLPCPICVKPMPSQEKRRSHIKSCAVVHCLTAEQILHASCLQKKQMGERCLLGLPSPASSTAKERRKTSGSKDKQKDPDLAMALALSSSLVEEETSRRLLREDQLLDLGLNQMVQDDRINNPVVLAHVMTTDPQRRRDRSRKGKGKKPLTILSTRIQEERERIISEKVATLLLMSQEEDPELRRISGFENCPSRRALRERFDPTSSLWNMSHCPLEHPLESFFVPDLVAFVEPHHTPIDHLLKNMSQIPGRNYMSQQHAQQTKIGSEFELEENETSVVEEYCTQLALAELMECLDGTQFKARDEAFNLRLDTDIDNNLGDNGFVIDSMGDNISAGEKFGDKHDSDDDIFEDNMNVTNSVEEIKIESQCSSDTTVSSEELLKVQQKCAMELTNCGSKESWSRVSGGSKMQNGIGDNSGKQEETWPECEVVQVICGNISQNASEWLSKEVPSKREKMKVGLKRCQSERHHFTGSKKEDNKSHVNVLMKRKSESEICQLTSVSNSTIKTAVKCAKKYNGKSVPHGIGADVSVSNLNETDISFSDFVLDRKNVPPFNYSKLNEETIAYFEESSSVNNLCDATIPFQPEIIPDSQCNYTNMKCWRSDMIPTWGSKRVSKIDYSPIGSESNIHGNFPHKQISAENVDNKLHDDLKPNVKSVNKRDRQVVNEDTRLVSRLLSDWEHLFYSSHNADVVIMTAGGIVKVHSLVLLVRCSALHKEADTNKAVQWPTVSYEAAVEFMHYLYSSRCNLSNTKDQLWNMVWDLSIKYDCLELSTHLESFRSAQTPVKFPTNATRSPHELQAWTGADEKPDVSSKLEFVHRNSTSISRGISTSHKNIMPVILFASNDKANNTSVSANKSRKLVSSGGTRAKVAQLLCPDSPDFFEEVRHEGNSFTSTPKPCSPILDQAMLCVDKSSEKLWNEKAHRMSLGEIPTPSGEMREPQPIEQENILGQKHLSPEMSTDPNFDLVGREFVDLTHSSEELIKPDDWSKLRNLNMSEKIKESVDVFIDEDMDRKPGCTFFKQLETNSLSMTVSDRYSSQKNDTGSRESLRLESDDDMPNEHPLDTSDSENVHIESYITNVWDNYEEICGWSPLALNPMTPGGTMYGNSISDKTPSRIISQKTLTCSPDIVAAIIDHDIQAKNMMVQESGSMNKSNLMDFLYKASTQITEKLNGQELADQNEFVLVDPIGEVSTKFPELTFERTKPSKSGVSDTTLQRISEDLNNSHLFDDTFELPSEVSKNLPVVSVPRVSQDPITPTMLHTRATRKVEVTPMPDFKTMPTPELKKQLDRIGVRPVSRSKAVLVLKHVYENTHPWVTDSEAETSFCETPEGKGENNKAAAPLRRKDGQKSRVRREVGNGRGSRGSRRCNTLQSVSEGKSNVQELQLSQSISSSDDSKVDCLEETLAAESDDQEISGTQKEDATSKVLQFVRKSQALYRSVLFYEPVWLETLHADLKASSIKCSLATLINILDDQCITFRTQQSAHRNRNNRKSPKKKKSTLTRMQK